MTGSLFDGAGPQFDSRRALRALAATDPALGALIERAGPFRLAIQELQSPFVALVESITYQQLTGKAAATIFGRLRDLFPRRRLTAKTLLEIPTRALRHAGLSRAKVLALQDLARRTLDGTVPPLAELARMQDESIVERLTQVRGIGPWTVQMLLIFRLGRPDVLPTTDYGIRKGFAVAFALKRLPTPGEVAERGEIWRPWRSVASWYLWRAAEFPRR